MGKRDGNNNGIRNLLIALIILCIVATGIMIKLCLDLTTEPIQPITNKKPVSLPITDHRANGRNNYSGTGACCFNGIHRCNG